MAAANRRESDDLIILVAPTLNTPESKVASVPLDIKNNVPELMSTPPDVIRPISYDIKVDAFTAGTNVINSAARM
jgi:hypothetical protein